MKYIFSILIVLASASLSFGQLSTIDFELEQKIKSSPDQIVKVSIEFRQNTDLDSLRSFFDLNNIALDERPYHVIKNLQETALKTQSTVMFDLGKLPQAKIKSIHQFWIVNMIIAELQASLIPQIAANQNIDLISEMTLHPLPLEPYRQEAVSYDRADQNIEPGLVAINARKMWELGYTGRGQLVYNFDTGVWPDHPSFSQRFLARRFPMEQSWLGYYRDYPNGIINDHGTHTLGTMIGLDKLAQDTIGVAFEAYWIANDYVGTTVASLPPLEEMIYGFEWALNPDGNILTSDDIPDVINNSWRWSDEPTQEFCDGFVVELMNAIEAVGIANVFSGGNSGPFNTSVSAPQRINTTIVNTFSVGSIDANQSAPFPISDFSTRGPTQCDGEGSLKIHPQVVAPGQNVRSAWGNNSYNSISGTSMACPHVSGAVLLLKEAFPFLSGQELLWALYDSAIDYGAPGEDNTFGNGLIDVYAAFLLLSESHQPVDPNSIDHDLAITGLSNISDMEIICDDSILPVVTCENLGDSTIRAIDVQYVFNKIDTLYKSFQDLNLLSGESMDLELETLDISAGGNYELEIKLLLTNTLYAETYDLYNNQYRIEFIKSNVKSVPVFEDFENGFDPALWLINNPDHELSWDTIQTGGLNNNVYSASMQFYHYNPRNAQKDQLILSNLLIPDEKETRLQYAWSYQPFFGSKDIRDTFRIKVWEDCRIENESLLTEKAGDALIVQDTISINFIPKHPWQWKRDTISLTEFAGKTISLVFEGTNMKFNNLYLDEISIDEKLNSNTEKLKYFQNSDLILYPNPASDRLYWELTDSDTEFNAIMIYDQLGQLVLENKLNRKSSNNIKIGQLIPGYYICILKGNKGFKTGSFTKG